MGVVGRPSHELDTPALLIDSDALHRNIELMAGRIRAGGVNWRPHAKCHKIPAIAHLQLAVGAIGVTCAKLGEAEVMADAGIRDILIANQIVGAVKICRLVNLRARADVAVAVDSPANIAELSAAAIDRGVVLRVLVEVDLGMGRCGIAPGEGVLELARLVDAAPGLDFAGLMSWESHCARIQDQQARAECIRAALNTLVETAGLCRAHGLKVDIVSCGGTGTYQTAAKVPGVTEIQAGGGIFNDARYTEIDGLDHEHALTVLTTVISRPNATRAIVDAGRKTMAADRVSPRPVGLSDVASVNLSAEHGRIEFSQPNSTLIVGDKLEFIVGDADMAMSLHDEAFIVRNGCVEGVWPILARGKIR